MTYAILAAGQITATGTAQELWPDTSRPSTGPRADWLAERNAVGIQGSTLYGAFAGYSAS
jgi:hypothetical protein